MYKFTARSSTTQTISEQNLPQTKDEEREVKEVEDHKQKIDTIVQLKH